MRLRPLVAVAHRADVRFDEIVTEGAYSEARPHSADLRLVRLDRSSRRHHTSVLPLDFDLV